MILQPFCKRSFLCYDVNKSMETILTSLSLGLLATISPCALPLYPGFLAYISGGQEGLQSKTSRYFQRWITRQFALHARLINILSGLLLLGVGIYDFSVNWSLLQVYLN